MALLYYLYINIVQRAPIIIAVGASQSTDQDVKDVDSVNTVNTEGGLHLLELNTTGPGGAALVSLLIGAGLTATAVGVGWCIYKRCRKAQNRRIDRNIEMAQLRSLVSGQPPLPAITYEPGSGSGTLERKLDHLMVVANRLESASAPNLRQENVYEAPSTEMAPRFFR